MFLHLGRLPLIKSNRSLRAKQAEVDRYQALLKRRDEVSAQIAEQTRILEQHEVDVARLMAVVVKARLGESEKVDRTMVGSHVERGRWGL
jgi:phage-related tail protein